MPIWDVNASFNQATEGNFNSTFNQSVVSNICLPPSQPPNSDIFTYPEASTAGIAFCQFHVTFSRSNKNSGKILRIFRDIIVPMIYNLSRDSLISRKD